MPQHSAPEQIAEWLNAPDGGRRHWDELCEQLIHRARDIEAIKTGDFLLASGKRSSIYFDGRVLSLDPHGCHLIAAMTLIHAAALNAEAVGGPAVGSVPVIGGTVALSHAVGKPLAGLFTRPAPKEHGAQKRVEGAPRKGMPVLAIEDTLTTGGSLITAIEALRQAGCRVAGALCVMDRNAGGREALAAAEVPLQAMMLLMPEGGIQPAPLSAAKAGYNTRMGGPQGRRRRRGGPVLSGCASTAAKN